MMNLHSIYFGQKHPEFTYEDYQLINKIKKLAYKHQRQATNNCNGEGIVGGKHYYVGIIDAYAKQHYGITVQSAYVDNSEVSIFYKEMKKIEEKINSLIMIHNRLNYQESNAPFKVEYQGDPRGSTVKLYYEGEFIDL